MSVIKLSNRYAKSLLELAIERDRLEEVYQDIKIFCKDCKDNPELILMLKSPIIQGDKKMDTLEVIYGEKFGELMMSFMRIVVKKRREFYLAEISKQFIRIYNDRKGIATATFTSAVKINEEITNGVKELLEKTTKKKINLKVLVDKDLIGGFVLKFEDNLYDASIQHQLNLLKKDFSNNEYIKKF